jgi:hypothetical protein
LPPFRDGRARQSANILHWNLRYSEADYAAQLEHATRTVSTPVSSARLSGDDQSLRNTVGSFVSRTALGISSTLLCESKLATSISATWRLEKMPADTDRSVDE